MDKITNFSIKIKRLIVNNQFILYIFIFFLAYFILLWVQAWPSFLDPDPFYHLKISKLMSQQGVVIDFPWLQYTVLKEHFIDHHFLFHVGAIPFIEIFGDFAGYKLYNVFLATIFVFFAYVFLKKFQARLPGFFIILMLCSPALIFRLSLARAIGFSLILLFAAIYCILRRRHWLLFAVAFIYVWSYNAFPLVLVMAVIYILAEAFYLTFLQKTLFEKVKLFFHLASLKDYIKKFFKHLFGLGNFKIIAACLGGIFCGIVINPYFPKNLVFYWQHIIQIGLINYKDFVNVGREWYPYSWLELITQSGIIFPIAILALIVFFITYKKQKTESLFFLGSSLFFLILTLQAKRHIEYFVPFVVFFSAFALTFALEEKRIKRFLSDITEQIWLIKLFIVIALLALVSILGVIGLSDINRSRQSFSHGYGFNHFKGISEYLLAYSQPGDIIMHTDWDDWPMLFYHNSENYYIVGLDPTFMYNYNKDLYWLYAEITQARRTGDLAQAVKEHFKAKYFIVNSDRVQLERNLQNDGGFIKVYQDKDGSIYKLKD